MLAVPPVVIAVLGAVGASALARLVVKEWRRINAELHPGQASMSDAGERDSLPKLKRDPQTGVYRAD